MILGLNMDLSFLDKSSGVTPLLVRLYDCHKTYGLKSQDNPQSQTELTKIVGDLLSINLSPREAELIADVLIALLRQAEKDLRHAMAERLSVLDNVPLRVVLQVVNDEIDIAGPMLRHSPVLGDMDLAYIIKSKSPEYWRAIAARQSLSTYVVDMLADTEDFDTALTLVENESIALTEHAVSILADLARNHSDLATPLIRRDEVTNEIASRMYQYVGQQLKQQIVEKYKINTSAMLDTIDEVVLEFVDAGAQEYIPSHNLIQAAERFKAKGLLTINMMTETLKRGQIQAFVAQFSQFTGLSPATIADILIQPSGQGLAVACKAFEISKSDFTSMYLLTNRIRNNGKMVDMKDMSRALHYYDAIKAELAKSILKNTNSGLSELND
jgi:uncharacterized protein (DUF2336 family)